MDSPGKLVLVVDDSIDNIQVMAEMLEHLGCEVLVATKGTQALDVATKVGPSAVILDVTMPQMDGFEVCRALKANPITAPIPVFFLSGHDGPEVRTKGIAAGAAGYLTKPIHWEDLQSLVEGLTVR